MREDQVGKRTRAVPATAIAAGAGAVGTLLAATAIAASPAHAIIGGVDATEEYPFMAALYDDGGEHYCGGALVSGEWVVTAGHCTEPEEITVRVGSADRLEGGGERGVAEVVLHPGFEVIDVGDDPAYPISEYLLRNDLALLRLDAPVDDRVPVAIAAASPSPGATVRGLGWGMVDEFGEEEKPVTLQELDTGIVPLDRCADVDAGGDLCSEHPTERAQMCVTDSGGPMLRRGAYGWELVGVVSRDGDFDVNPACVGPMAITDTAAHADWIASVITSAHAR
ncbi:MULTISPECIES: S1 family peptidase [unclassified Nocardiopsis]|uniref:S1 family peptidase n=1 Tax=Nocardiopsis TaxID=2013 RepID=UPI00387B9959